MRKSTSLLLCTAMLASPAISHAARTLLVEWQDPTTSAAAFNLYVVDPVAATTEIVSLDANARSYEIADPLSGRYQVCLSVLDDTGDEGPCSATQIVDVE